MTNFRIPDAILAQHTAILGKTGSGKTTTGKVCIEQVVDEDYRVCIIDPVKSDWWGLTSSADGKRAGLPFTILGGPHGHVPLHHTSGKAIADVVANGSLRLSILDMAQFPPGGAQHFFVDFIPRLMQKMKGVLYLVIEEAHEFAPKERAGFGKENMSIHYAKSVATGGRSKGIRLIVLDQRVQALHNAVLGSCETTIVHRMTQPADQEPVVKWMKANVKDKQLREQITDSMSKLKTGTGWVCSGEAEIFSLLEFPKARTFDNSKTPDKDDDLHQVVKTAQVDVEALRGIIGEAVAEAEANDPAKLRARIAELEAAAARPGPMIKAAPQNCVIDHDGYARAAREQGFADGLKHAADVLVNQVREHVAGILSLFRGVLAKADDYQFKFMPVPIPADYLKGFPVRTVAEQHGGGRCPECNGQVGDYSEVHEMNCSIGQRVPDLKKVRGFDDMYDDPGRDGVALVSAAHPKSNGPMPKATLNPKSLETIEIERLSKQERAFLNVLADRRAKTTTRDQLALFALYSSEGGGIDRALASLRGAGYVEGPGASLAITDAGVQALSRHRAHEMQPKGQALRESWLAKLDGAQEKKFLTFLIHKYPTPITRDYLAQACNYSLEGGGIDRALAKLRKIGLIVGPGKALLASEDLF